VWFDLANNELSGELPTTIMAIPGTSLFSLHGNGCLTATGDAFLSWLSLMDPLWGDGC
jgi:hypothetical protein